MSVSRGRSEEAANGEGGSDAGRGVVVWAPMLFQYYSLEPVIRELRSRGVPVMVCCRRDSIKTLQAYLDLDAEHFEGYRDFAARRGRGTSFAAGLADRMYRKLRVSSRFSVMYQRVRSEGWSEPVLEAILPRLRGPLVNERYSRFFEEKLPDLFDGRRVLTTTPAMRPYWLAPVADRVVTVMESWDHPIKRPFLHRPRVAFAWNDALVKDIRESQGLDSIERIYPLKFRYMAELSESGLTEAELAGEVRDPRIRREIATLPSEPFMLYIATSSSVNEWGFPGEVKLVRQLSEYAATRGLDLYVKPKPNGLPAEFVSVEGRPRTQIGLYGSGDHAADLLNPDYHIYRYVLLKRASLVINVATTFGLEAALAGVPILQIDLGRPGGVFGGFPLYLQNPHVANYLLLPHLHRFYSGDDVNDLYDALDEARLGAFASEYSERLRDWLQGDRTLAASVSLVADALCGSRSPLRTSS